jgi:cell division protein FtsL
VSPAQAAPATTTGLDRATRSTARDAGANRGASPRRPRLVAVRAVEPPKGPLDRLVAPLHLGSQLGRIGTLVAVALFVSVFGVVIFQTLIVQGQARLDNLNAKTAAEQERSRDLHQQVADLEAPSRIVAAARDRLGMVPSGPVGYLSPRPDDGDRSAYVAPPTTTSSSSRSSTSSATSSATPSTKKPTSTTKKPTSTTTPTTAAKATSTTTAKATTR